LRGFGDSFAVVAVSIAATMLLFLYNIVVAVFRSAFGIELPHLY
jgi:hypothetical protein